MSGPDVFRTESNAAEWCTETEAPVRLVPLDWSIRIEKRMSALSGLEDADRRSRT